MAHWTITHSIDGLSATLSVAPGPDGDFPSVEELRAALEEYGVVFGIDGEKLALMAQRRTGGLGVEVARGSPSLPGSDGKLDLLVDLTLQGKPRERDDGSVDLRDLRYAINVRAGDPLQRRIPPIPGRDGMTVMGERIPAPAPLDARFRAGAGTAPSADDPNLLIACIDGAVSVLSDGKIEVRTEKTIKGDIDYSTGNVSFSGNLAVRGTVRAGFSIEVDGDLVVGGRIEDSVIRCAGVLEVHGGVAGSGKGKISVGQGLKARHIENFLVESDRDIMITEDVMNCRLFARGMVFARSIIGGTTTAARGIDATSIGNAAEVKTIIDASGHDELMRQTESARRELSAVLAAVTASKEELFAAVRDGMDSRGVLDAEKQTRIDRIKGTLPGQALDCRRLDERIAGLEKELAETTAPVIRARTVYPNVIVRRAGHERVVREKLTGATILFEGEQIIIQKEMKTVEKP